MHVSKLSRAADALMFLLLALVLGMFCFAIWTFDQYRKDVYETRQLFCRTPQFEDTQYCKAVKSDSLPGQRNAR